MIFYVNCLLRKGEGGGARGMGVGGRGGGGGEGVKRVKWIYIRGFAKDNFMITIGW